MRTFRKKRPHNSMGTGRRERAGAGARLAAAARAASIDAIRRSIWESDVDIDELVDSFATTHAVAAYRERDIQKAAVDELVENLRQMPSADKKLIADVVDRMYSRFLLAGDVGFELGFNAARNLMTASR